MIESADSGAFNESAPESGDTSDQVYNAGTGEIDNARSEQEVGGFGGACPAVSGPEPMRNHGVNETGQESGVDQVGDELGTFGDGTAGDTGGGNGKSPLIEEVAVVERGGREGSEREEVFANEGVGGRSEGESEAEEVVEETAGCGVEDVGEHDVHGVFGSYGTGTEHGEAELHGEDEVGREEEVGGVDGIGGVSEFGGDGGELAADVGGGGG